MALQRSSRSNPNLTQFVDRSMKPFRQHCGSRNGSPKHSKTSQTPKPRQLLLDPFKFPFNFPSYIFQPVRQESVSDARNALDNQCKPLELQAVQHCSTQDLQAVQHCSTQELFASCLEVARSAKELGWVALIITACAENHSY